MERKSVEMSGLIGITFLALFFVLTSQAQEMDTIRVVDLSGAPGDTVNLPIWLVNTFNVSGITFRIVLDLNILKPDSVDTSGSRVVGVYDYFGTQIDTVDGAVYWLGLNWHDPANNYVTPGSGVIAYVRCVVDSQAPIGAQSSIEFVDDTLSHHITSLSDPEGHIGFPVEDGGLFTVSSVGVRESEAGTDFPSRYSLGQVFPNPVSDQAMITYACPRGAEARHMTIRVYDVVGRAVSTLFDGPAEPGYHFLKWDGRSDRNSTLPGGVYFCRMNVENGPRGLTRKFVLLK